MMQQNLHQDIVSYLAYLKCQDENYKNDETLDVAIDSLCATFKIGQPTASTNLLNYSKEQSKGEKLKSLGNDAYASKDYEDAIFYFTKAIDNLTGSDAAKCYYNRGQAYKTMNNLEKAEENFRKAIQLDSGYQKARAALSSVLQQQGKKDDSGHGAGLQDIFANIGDPTTMSQQILNNPAVQDALKDPEVEQLFQDPEVQQTLQDVLSNPMNALTAMQNPKLAPIVSKLLPFASNMMNMFKGGQ